MVMLPLPDWLNFHLDRKTVGVRLVVAVIFTSQFPLELTALIEVVNVPVVTTVAVGTEAETLVLAVPALFTIAIATVS